jgi:hypothetical protein
VLFDALFAGVLLCQWTHWIADIKRDVRRVQIIIVSLLAALSLLPFFFTSSAIPMR